MLDLSKKTPERSSWDNVDVDIEHVGTKITLPGEPGQMPLRDAIKALERKAKDEETVLDVNETLMAYPEDALVALNAAMRQTYGWASPTPVMSWFGPIAPDLVTVKTGPYLADSIQVPFGAFTLPGVENPIQTHRVKTPSGWALAITGTVRKKEADVVRQLARLAREILLTSSIYKGKAIRLHSDSDGNLDSSTAPDFLHTDHIREDELILNGDELDQVKAALWAPVRFTELCVQHKIPLNRGVLLEGTYGTGKTMTAHVTSKVCVDNGWTYILLDDVRALKDALLFAQRYAPAVVFAEDVDRVAAVRDQKGNDLLNTIDGVLTKNAQVITVLTTNHVDKLDKAMLRPGRLDAVITIRPPEAWAVERLIRLYGRSLIAVDADLSGVSAFLAGNIPATIREVVERSKLAMISNFRTEVHGHDLMTSARAMENHLNLLKDKPKDVSDEHKLGAALATIVSKASGVSSDDRKAMASLQNAMVSNTDMQAKAAEHSARATSEASKLVANATNRLNSNLTAVKNVVSTAAEQIDEIHTKVAC